MEEHGSQQMVAVCSVIEVGSHQGLVGEVWGREEVGQACCGCLEADGLRYGIFKGEGVIAREIHVWRMWVTCTFDQDEADGAGG